MFAAFAFFLALEAAHVCKVAKTATGFVLDPRRQRLRQIHVRLIEWLPIVLS